MSKTGGTAVFSSRLTQMLKDNLVADLFGLLDALGIERVRWVGHDWGALLGMMAVVQEPERIERLWANTRYFQGELRRAGFNVGGINTPATETPITPVID